MRRTWVVSKKALTISDYEVDDDSLLVMPVSDATAEIIAAEKRGAEKQFLYAQLAEDHTRADERERIAKAVDDYWMGHDHVFRSDLLSVIHGEPPSCHDTEPKPLRHLDPWTDSHINYYEVLTDAYNAMADAVNALIAKEKS
jgi:hypothetical protein